MRKAALFSVFLLFPNFIFFRSATSTTLSPYEEERYKILRDLNGLPTPADTILINWLVNERVRNAKDFVKRMETVVKQNGEEIGALKAKLNNMKNIALKLLVIPYFCQKFELYGEKWDQQDVLITDFDPNDLTGTSVIGHHLDEPTCDSYKGNAKKWNRILCSSVHPLAIKFKTALQNKYPGISLSILAKDLGLAIALMNNAKHGVIANLPEAMEILQIDSAIEALSKWNSLSDPLMLDIIYEFEKTTTNRNWKPT